MSEPLRHLHFSAQAAEMEDKTGQRPIYARLLKNGKLMRVTCIGDDAEASYYAWPDKVYLGRGTPDYDYSEAQAAKSQVSVMEKLDGANTSFPHLYKPSKKPPYPGFQVLKKDHYGHPQYVFSYGYKYGYK